MKQWILVARYVYSGIDKEAQNVTGTLGACCKLHLVFKLARQHVILLTIKKIPKISLAKQVEICFSLRQLITAGVSIAKSFAILDDQLSGIHQYLNQGQRLSTALENYAMDAAWVKIFQVAESSGDLGKHLMDLEQYLRNKNSFYNKIRSAIRYPIFVLIFLLLIQFVLSQILLPHLEETADSSQFLFVSYAIPWIVFIVIVGLLILYRSNPLFFGSIYRDWVMWRFAATLGLLHGVGIPLLEALKQAYIEIRHPKIRRKLANLEELLLKGNQLSQALQQSGVFSKYFCNFIELSEQSGNLSYILQSTSIEQQKEHLRKIDSLIKTIEPILLLLVSLVLITLILGIIYPLYENPEVF